MPLEWTARANALLNLYRPSPSSCFSESGSRPLYRKTKKSQNASSSLHISRSGQWGVDWRRWVGSLHDGPAYHHGLGNNNENGGLTESHFGNGAITIRPSWQLFPTW